ncbi:MAG: hypothetical protein QNJ91_14205 [Gammaproteobacteria bacterium]|nr:hypothetical protein [Gammaproteobacteria bacterium]
MNRLPPVVSLLLLFALSTALTGCRSNPFDEVPERLTLQVRTFEDVVRWGVLEKMYLFLKRDSDEPVQIQPGLDNVRVTGYELIEQISEVEPMRWRQAAQIDYVLTDRQVVRRLVDFQVWESDDEGKTWYRTTPVPVFQ